VARETSVHDFSSIQRCASWRDLVAISDLDAIDICLPTDMHAVVSTAALEAGKHVFCEKPMALTVEECSAMIAAAERQNRILMIGQVLRFWPEYRYLENFVRSGEHGKIRSATFVRRCGIPDWSRWLTDEPRSGGAVLDLLIHDIDQALMLFGMPDRVAGKSIGDPDTLMATLIYPGGPEVRIQGGWFEAGTPLAMSFQVRAERAELEWSARGLLLRDQTGRQEALQAPGGDAYDDEVAYFVDCCQKNRRPEHCMPEESARAVQVALQLKQSRAAGGEAIRCSA
jgi:predicted dehydrogenase